MRLRTGIILIAVLGVLMQAAALARHSGMMLSAQLQDQALAAELAASLCHGGEGAAPNRGTDLPGAPKPSGTPGDCPCCCGLPPAFIAAAPQPFAAPVRFAVMARWVEPERLDPGLRHAVCPPPRGPPAARAVSA
jgi:hypothetical protein